MQAICDKKNGRQFFLMLKMWFHLGNYFDSNAWICNPHWLSKQLQNHLPNMRWHKMLIGAWGQFPLSNPIKYSPSIMIKWTTQTTSDVVSWQKDKGVVCQIPLLQQIVALFAVIDTNRYQVVHFYSINWSIAHWCFSMYHLPNNIIIQYCGHNLVSIDLNIVCPWVD